MKRCLNGRSRRMKTGAMKPKPGLIGSSLPKRRASSFIVFTLQFQRDWVLVNISLCWITALAFTDLVGSWLAINAYSQTFVSMKHNGDSLAMLINLFPCERFEVSNVQGVCQ